MGQSVSSDLRLRIVRGVAAGHSRRSMALRFEVSPSTAVRVQARYAASASVAPPGRVVPKDRASSERIGAPSSPR